MGKTSIEWTDWSANPIKARHRETGDVGHYCELISPGCAHCYSSRFQPRFGLPQFTGIGHRDERLQQMQIFLDYGVLQKILSRKKPTKIFWEDMSDLFGDWVPEEMIDVCFAVMALTPQHTHQVLTKRPRRMSEYLTGIVAGESGYLIEDLSEPEQDLCMRWGAAAGTLLDGPWIHGPGKRLRPAIEKFIDVTHGEADEQLPWPPPNVWLGVSGERQIEIDERHYQLPSAAVRFWSLEPLLGPIDCNRAWANSMLPDWVIVGGESGDGARPMHPDWVRSIRDQCQAAGVAFFFKQWGAWIPRKQMTPQWLAQLDQRVFANAKPIEGDQAYRVGKQAAGRLLDGREWNEFPSVEVPHA